jgi:hypothetical protein
VRRTSSPLSTLLSLPFIIERAAKGSQNLWPGCGKWASPAGGRIPFHVPYL